MGITQHGNKFLSIIKNRRFTKRFAPFEWTKLQRVPKWFDENHPMADWLKYKQFFVGISLPESMCYRESLVEDVAGICEEATPLVRFLNNCLT